MLSFGFAIIQTVVEVQTSENGWFEILAQGTTSLLAAVIGGLAVYKVADRQAKAESGRRAEERAEEIADRREERLLDHRRRELEYRRENAMAVQDALEDAAHATAKAAITDIAMQLGGMAEAPNGVPVSELIEEAVRFEGRVLKFAARLNDRTIDDLSVVYGERTSALLSDPVDEETLNTAISSMMDVFRMINTHLRLILHESQKELKVM
jgi:hypothetical protein